MKKYLKIIITTLLILLNNINVYALEEPEKYTPQYKKYLKLTEEQKRKVDVIPSKYGISLKEYNQSDQPIFKVETFNGFKSFKKSTSEIPSKFVLTDNYNIKVENQGQEGNCWTFASMETIETYLQIHENITFDFSENHLNYLESNLFSETNAYRDINTGGTYSYFEDYVFKQFGPVLEEDYPYYDHNKKKYKSYTKEEYPSLANVTPLAYVEEFKEFPYLDKENNTYTEEELTEYRNEIKKHIMENGALYASTIGPSYFEGKYYNYETHAAYFDNTTDPDFSDHRHAVAIIGWDDDYSKENFVEDRKPKHDGAYIALNSWGDYFGENGLYYISYDDVFIEEDLSGIKSAATDKSKLTKTTTITIKDKNLYQKLKQILKRQVFESNDSKQTITMQNKALSEVYTLNLKNSNISDLSGLEEFYNLDDLALGNNNISSIANLKSLHKLKGLDLSNNNFTEVPIELSDAELTNLFLDYNPIEDFSNLKKIKSISTLGLEGTNFTDDDMQLLKDFEELKGVNLAKTKTTDYSLLQQDLYHLNISYNENIKYDTIPSTMFLEIANTTTTEEQFNQIKDTSIMRSLNISYTNIKDLSIIPNDIGTIYISGNKNLTNLDNLKNADSIFYKDADLEDVSIFQDFNASLLNLADNNISNYQPLIDSVNNNDKVLFLNLSNNKIKEIPYNENIYLTVDNNNIKPDSFYEYDNTIESIKNQTYEETLKVDIARENLFTDIASYLQELHSLDYEITIQNATVDYKKGIFKITDYNKDVLIKIKNGKHDGSTIKYKIEQVDSSVIDYLYINAQETKLTYIEGENFNAENLKVYARYNNGSSTEVTDYEIINGTNIQKDTEFITIKKDNLTTNLYINVIPKDETTTLTFQNKNIYDATLRKIKELEEDRKIFSSYFDRLEILINTNEEEQTITIYKEDLNEINDIEIISDDIGSLSDIKQLKRLIQPTINSKNFSDLNELKHLQELVKEQDEDEELIRIVIKNNEVLTTIDSNIITSLTIKNSKINDINNLTNLNYINYEGTEDLAMNDILDTLGAMNIEITKNIEDLSKDEKGNIILPNIFKEFSERDCTFEVTIYDQLRDEQYINPYIKHTIELEEKDGNFIINSNSLKEINYDGNNQFIEISVKDINEKYMMLHYKYRLKYKLFESLELNNTNPIEVEEDTIPDLSNLEVYKVYSNKEKELTSGFEYTKEPVTKETTSITISYTEDGTTNEIEIPITVTEHTHEWGEWQTTKEPTEDEFGQKERVCLKNGNHKEIEKIDKLPKQEEQQEPTTNNNTQNNNNYLPPVINKNIPTTENNIAEDIKQNNTITEEKKETTIDKDNKTTSKESEDTSEDTTQKEFKLNKIIPSILILATLGILFIILAKRKKDDEDEERSHK